MKIFDRIKLILLTTSVSYTFVMLANFGFAITTINSRIIYEVFVMCCIINIIIHITHEFVTSSIFVRDTISISSIVLVVSYANIFIYNNEYFGIDNFLVVILFSIIIYEAVIIIVFIGNYKDAKIINDKINKKIQKR